MSDQVGNPEDRFSHDAAHIIIHVVLTVKHFMLNSTEHKKAKCFKLIARTCIYMYITSGKHVHAMSTPLKPHFICSKTGVCSSIYFFIYLV